MPRHKEILASYPRRETFLADFRRQGAGAVLFVTTSRPLELSEQVTVVVDFPTEQMTFRLQGRVVSRRRASAHPQLPPGVEVVLAPEQARPLQLVLDHAAGKQVRFVKRAGQRLPAAMEISYRSLDALVTEMSEDIGRGGLFVRTEQLLPLDSRLECRLKPPGRWLALRLPARVAWHRESRPRGMGLAFEFTSASQRRQIENLVEKLQKQHGRAVERTLRRFRSRSD